MLISIVIVGIVAINVKTEFMTNCNLDLFCTPPKLISFLPWFLKITVMGLVYRNFEEFFFFFPRKELSFRVATLFWEK